VSAAGRSDAFRFGTNAYGFQFHLEADAAVIEHWLQLPSFRAEPTRCSTTSWISSADQTGGGHCRRAECPPGLKLPTRTRTARSRRGVVAHPKLEIVLRS
jgi:hypothetical protein